jgi:tetratricopeptide (TPR) repeat protein
MSPRLLKILACICLILAPLAAFWGVWHNQFVNFDDDKYVTDNFPVQWGLTLKGFTWAFSTTHAGNWHPLTWLSHMLDCQLFGLGPGGHHLTNLLFHLANTLLLFLLLQRMTRALWPSALVAALFAVHPLHVESVAWVAERKDVLSTFFWMLTMWAYVWYVEGPEIKRYLLVLLCYSLGLMAKPMLVTLPLVLLLLDYWPLGRWPREYATAAGESEISPAGDPPPQVALKRLIWEKVPLLVLAASSSLVTFYAQRAGGAVLSLQNLPLTVRLANALVAYLSYIGKMVWPSRLAAFYPHPENTLPLWQALGAAIVLGVISILVIRQARRLPYLLVGWLWYLGTLVPVIGLVQVGSQALADRYTYVPLIGLFIIVAWGAVDLGARWRPPRYLLPWGAGIILSVFTVCTWLQVRHWHDSVSLYEHSLKVGSIAPLVHNNLGNALFLQGKVDQALGHYAEALRLQPNYPEAYNNRGAALSSTGQVDQAIDCYTQALRLRPDYVDAHYNLGGVLFSQGKMDEAVWHYRQVLRLRPDHIHAHNNLGNALFLQGGVEEAITHYQEDLRLQPGHAEAHNNLGVALVSQGKVEEGVSHYQEALRLKPDYADAHYNLGTALFLQGQVDQGLAQYLGAVRLNPNHPQALDSLARVRATSGMPRLRDGGAAVELADKANQLTGYSQPEFLDTLAAAYAEVGRFPEAVQTSQKAMELARSHGKAELARDIGSRLRLYQAGRPYHGGLGKVKSP